ATCVNLINPSVIVIGGSLAQAGEHLLAGIREVVYRRSLPLATEHLRVAPSVAGERAGVMGAAVLAIDHVLSPESVEAACAALGTAGVRPPPRGHLPSARRGPRTAAVTAVPGGGRDRSRAQPLVPGRAPDRPMWWRLEA